MKRILLISILFTVLQGTAQTNITTTVPVSDRADSVRPTTAPVKKIETSLWDTICFLNGTTRLGDVTALSNDEIQFAHKGESVQYKFYKSEVQRIKYATGRTGLRYLAVNLRIYGL